MNEGQEQDMLNLSERAKQLLERTLMEILDEPKKSIVQGLKDGVDDQLARFEEHVDKKVQELQTIPEEFRKILQQESSALFKKVYTEIHSINEELQNMPKDLQSLKQEIDTMTEEIRSNNKVIYQYQKETHRYIEEFTKNQETQMKRLVPPFSWWHWLLTVAVLVSTALNLVMLFMLLLR